MLIPLSRLGANSLKPYKIMLGPRALVKEDQRQLDLLMYNGLGALI